jgi:hypothetical protein
LTQIKGNPTFEEVTEMIRVKEVGYLEAIRKRYRKFGRIKKRGILDEFCAVCGYNRKYAIRLLHKKKVGLKKKRGRRSWYNGEELLEPLKAIWLSSDQMCSKKLKVAIKEWLPHYEQERGLLSDIARGQLYKMSAATIDRLLKPLRVTWQRKNPVQFTRSRPYRKNDNAHVEQKNWTHVRHLFGYDRFENPKLVGLMNDLYKNEWSLYQNHFRPTMKLVEKKKINSKYFKRYDTPKTPYERLLECQYISGEVKERLKKQHAALNPFELKRNIEKKLKGIFKWVSLKNNPRNAI